MFSRRLYGAPDSFKLSLEYGSPGLDLPNELRFLNTLDYPQPQSQPSQVRLPVVAAALEFEFTSDESETVVVERFGQKKSNLLLDRIEERVVVQLVDRPAPHGPHGGPHGGAVLHVSLQLSIACRQPVLRSMQLYRLSSSGSPSDAVMQTLMSHCELGTVWKLKSAEGFGNWWCTAASTKEWTNLRNMNLSHCGLTVLPPGAGEITSLRILRLSHNKLTVLPSELQALSSLEVLAVDHNLLTSIPAELRRCSALRELNLEGNKLTTPVLDLRSLYNLQSLQLFGNPLEYLPELSPCTQLRSLSLANVRIMADAMFSRWEVEVSSLSYMARTHKLSTLFKLTFRRSSLQHPLLAGALGRIAEDRSNCELIAKEEAAIQQLVLMALSENPLVVGQACKTIGHLAEYSPATAILLIEHDVLSAVVTLMKAPSQDSQLCGLNVLSSLGQHGSDSVSAQLLSPSILQRLHHLIKNGDPSVRQAALFSLSNLCFCRDNKVMVRKADGLLQTLVELAQPHASQGTSDLSRLMAVRALAVLGENEQVRLALRLPPIHRRGLRILCMDGGGMRGMVTVQILRHLEQRLGRPVGSVFDLVVGTSTGAILAVSLGVLKYSLDMCEGIYTKLGHKVFNNQAAAARENEMATWTESLYRMYKNGSQNIRAATAVVFAGCKHDASTFESLLKDMCNLVKMNCVSDQFIDATMLGGPKVLVVATLASTLPAVPYVFRSYELPVEAERRAAKIGGWSGSSKHMMWQAVRASSAAPYYLDEFSIGEERFQDGAAIANNPTLVAIQQAQLLWPDIPIDCVVSLGSGLQQTKPRERGMHSYVDTGNLLIESATSTERIHEAAATLLNMVPGVKYFRFQPVDDRCTIELDDIDPKNWALLKVATEEFCIAHAARFDETVAALLATEHDTELDALAMASNPLKTGGSASIQALSVTSPRVPALRLGVRRGLLLLEAPRGHSALAGSLTERLADAVVARLPTLTRRADVGAAAGRLTDSHMTQLASSCGAPGAGATGSGVLSVHHQSVATSSSGGAGWPASERRASSSGGAPGSSAPLAGFGSVIDEAKKAQPSEAARRKTSPSAAVATAQPLAAPRSVSAPVSEPAMARDAASSDGPSSSSSLVLSPGRSGGGAPHAEAAHQTPMSPSSSGGGGTFVMPHATSGQHPRGASVVTPAASAAAAAAAASAAASAALSPRLDAHPHPHPHLHPQLHAPPAHPHPPFQQTAPRPLQMTTHSPTAEASSKGTAATAAPAAPAPPGTSAVATAAAPAASSAAAPSTFLNYFIPTSWTSTTTSATATSATITSTTATAPPASTPASSGSAPTASAPSATLSTSSDPAPPSPLGTSPASGGLLQRKSEGTAIALSANLAGVSAAAPQRSSEPGSGSGQDSLLEEAEAVAASRHSLAERPPHNLPLMPEVPPSSAPRPHTASPALPEPSTSSGSLPPHQLIRALLQDLSESLGVVHLALHGAGEAGLVLQWRHEVFAVLEPGPDAMQLVRELGHDPAITSLSRLCAGCPSRTCFQAGDAHLLKLAQQQVTTATGSQVSSYLFQRTCPLRLLLPEHVSAMVREWSGLLVVSATPLPRPLVEAMLRAGVKAVVAPGEDAWAVALGRAASPRRDGGGHGVRTRSDAPRSMLVRATSSLCVAEAESNNNGAAAAASAEAEGDLEAAVLAFFAAFYKALFGGEAVLGAIQAGESSAPGLEGAFVCYHL